MVTCYGFNLLCSSELDMTTSSAGPSGREIVGPGMGSLGDAEACGIPQVMFEISG